MIKGRLGMMVWADTLNDPLAVTPFDLIAADETKQAADVEPTDDELIDTTHDLMEMLSAA